MEIDQPIYVLATDILVDYVDIIPGVGSQKPKHPTVDLENAKIIVPSAVVRELTEIAKDDSECGKAAQTVLRRLSDITEEWSYTMEDVYRLRNLSEAHQVVVLPIDKNFHDSIPFYPADSDTDGQVILAALTAVAFKNSLSNSEISLKKSMGTIPTTGVTILTNKDGLAIRARERGIKAQRYSHERPKAYTGRRDLVVPSELFKEFCDTGRIGLEAWNKYLPDEPRLICNEFIIMEPANGEYPAGYDPYYDPNYCYVGRYDQGEKAIVRLRYFRDFPVGVRSVGQAIYAEALMHPNISAVICSGPAGSGKTYLAAIYGYQACRAGEFICVRVIPCDTKNTHGALPGDLDEKMDPEVQPLKNALRNYLLNEDPDFRKELANLQKYGTGSEAKKKAKSQGKNEKSIGEKRSIKDRLDDRVDLTWNNWFSNIPNENARGRDFAYELAIYDEFQDQTVSQADTLIKRLGKGGKFVITGDVKQIHSSHVNKEKNGLVYVSTLLMDCPMVAQINLEAVEVERHPLVKWIAMRQE